MSPYRSIHCAVYSPPFKANISLIPVTYNSGKNRKESGKFAHVSTMRKLTRMNFTMLKERKKWKYESPALTQSKISKLEVA